MFYNACHLYFTTGLFAIRLQGIITDLEHRLEKQTADHGRSIVTRDLELEALGQQEEKMRLEILQLKENTDKLVHVLIYNLLYMFLCRVL